MSRIAPPPPENLSTVRKAVAWEKEIEVQLITRLFGGGARPREIDERSWLRPAALKSALRFWWRATHAHRPEYDSLKKLKEREDLLFGTAARFKENEILGGPGWLSVEVRNANPANLDRPGYDPKADSEVGKAVGITYYPAAAQEGKEAARLGSPGKGDRALIRLVLEPSDAEAEKEILAALRAFLLLGGIGSRSRRGAGALAVYHREVAERLEIPSTAAAVGLYLKTWIDTAPGMVPLGVFSLARAVWSGIGSAFTSGGEAQEAALATLREVRQSRIHPPKWDKQAPWGQTDWPEPDAIRLEVGTSSHPTHEDRRSRFPRAILGLPIVFKFHDKDKEDPGRHTLVGVSGDAKRFARFASPLLLRPVQVWRTTKDLTIREFLPVALFTSPTLPPGTYPRLEPTPEKKDPRKTLSAPRTFTQHSFAEAAEDAGLIAKLEAAFKSGFGGKK